MNNSLSKWKIYKIIKKLCRFYMVGGIAFLWNALLVYLLLDVLHYPYYVAIIAMVLYAIPIYYLQKHLTFKYHRAWDSKRILLFISLVVCYQLFSYVMNWLLYNMLGSHIFSLVISTILFTILSYIMQNFLIFEWNNV